jgi:flagellar hook-associated protein 2
MASISTTGLVSGIDINSLVTQVVAAAKGPVLTWQTRQAVYQQQIGALSDFSTRLGTLYAVSSSVNNPANFNVLTTDVTKTPSGNSLLTASADATAITGSYAVTVQQLAQADKRASAGFVDQNTTAVAAGNGTFKWRVGNSGTEYSATVNSTTTLQGLRDAINAAGGSVTATIINNGSSSNPYRLVLTSNATGADNTITVTQNDTTLDFTNKKVGSAYASTTNSFSGTVTSNAGNNYTGTTNKAFLVQAVSGGAPDTATYKYSVDGGITWLGYGGQAFNASALANTAGAGIVASSGLSAIDGAGTANEGVQIGFGATGTLAIGDKFSVDVYNPELQQAQNAVVKIDNTTYTSTSNTITNAIQGVTLNLTQADASNPVTLSVSADPGGLVDKIKNFVNAYNDVMTALNGQLSYDPKAQRPSLFADASLLSVQTLLRNVVTGTIPGLSGNIRNLSQIGITSDAHTGQLSVNSAKLASAISTDPNGIRRLFLGIGTPTNGAVAFTGLSAKTAPGTYGIAINVAPQKATIGGSTDATLQDLSSNGLTSDETLSFTYSNNNTASTPTISSFSATLTAGSRINDIVNALNSTFATQKAGLSASNDGGKLKITSSDYGKDIAFTVVSNQAGATQTGIGTTVRSAEGVDVAGTINGHSATGKGNVLTSSSGFAEDGLSVSTTATTPGLYGTISVSRGVGDRLNASLDAFTNATTGIFVSKTNQWQKSIDTIQDTISKINDRATQEGNRLRDQLVQLESTLGQLQSTGSFLSTQLAKLPSFAPIRQG